MQAYMDNTMVTSVEANNHHSDLEGGLVPLESVNSN